MRVLFVSHSSYFNGGANRSLATILEYLKEKNIEVYVLVPNNQGDFIDYLNSNEIPVLYCKYNTLITKNIRGFSGYLRKIKLNLKLIKDIITSIKYKNKIKEYNFDIIYTNTRVIFIGAFIARFLDIPHVWHIREFIQENDLSSIPMSNNIINELSDKVIVISEAIRRSIISKVEANKINLVYNGIQDSLRPKASNFKLNGEFNILLAGTIISAKGQLDAAKAINILVNRGFHDITLFYAGSDPDSRSKTSYKREIIRFIEDNNLHKNIIFLDEVKDLNSLRLQMKIELMCSKSEAFGRVTIEGMKSGLVVIGANSGATPELIQHGENGLLYSVGDYEDLANQIETIYLDKVLADKISYRAKEFTKNNFTVEQNGEAILNILQCIN